MTVALRPLSLGELLDRTFQLYRQNALVFIGIMALPGLVPLALTLMLAPVRGGSAGSIAMAFLLGAALLICQLVVFAVCQAATITAVSELYLGRPISLSGALGAARGRIGEVLTVSFFVGLLIMLGFVLLIVPGVLLALRWAVVIPVAIIEHQPAREAMARSSALTEGYRGRAFAIYLVYFVIAAIIGAIWQFPIGLFVAMGDPSTLDGTGWGAMLIQLGSFVSQALVGPLLTIAMSLFYYDQRVRKEAFDLDHMISRIDEAEHQTPATI